jgi:type IV secretion system protein VirB9
MKRIAIFALLSPTAALAQQVPAIETADSLNHSQVEQLVKPPWPPAPAPQVSPSAPLNPKERRAAAGARRWKDRPEMPRTGADGVTRWLYGATMPTVVCAPLHVCNIALEPGEQIMSIDIGDPTRWGVPKEQVVSGPGGEVEHIILKPTDAGLVSNMDIETDRRSYIIKLVSTQHEYTPLVAFDYPSERLVVRRKEGQVTAHGGPYYSQQSGASGEMDFNYSLSGDTDVPWKPVSVYSTDDGKTHIILSKRMAHHAMPVAVELAQ